MIEESELWEIKDEMLRNINVWQDWKAVPRETQKANRNLINFSGN